LHAEFYLFAYLIDIYEFITKICRKDSDKILSYV